MNNKLVFGLGGGLVYSCGGKGLWKQVLPKILDSFDNSVLVSTVDMPLGATKLIYECVGKDRLYLDSGGFTLYKRETKLGKDNPLFHQECEKMKRKFAKMLQQGEYHQIFELDNEYFRVDEDLLSPRNYCRDMVKEITGKYPTPVFKMHQGFQYWKDLCESELYDALAIGGLAQTRSWNTCTDEIKKMMDYARVCGKKVHLLGCQNVEAFKTIRPDTVDYSIFQYAINMQYVKEDMGASKFERLSYDDMKQQIVLYAISRAKSRSFLYNSFSIETGSEEVAS